MPALNITPTPAASAQASNTLAVLNAEAESGDSFSAALAREMHADHIPDGFAKPVGKNGTHDRKPDDHAETVSPEAAASLLAAVAYPPTPPQLDATAGTTLTAAGHDHIETDSLIAPGVGTPSDSAPAERGRAESTRAESTKLPFEIRSDPQRAATEINPDQLAQQLLSAHADPAANAETRLPTSFAPTVLAEIIRSLPQAVQATLAAQYPTAQPGITPSVPERSTIGNHLQGNWLARALQAQSDTPAEARAIRVDAQATIPLEDTQSLRMAASPAIATSLISDSVPLPDTSLINAPATPAMQALMEDALAAPAYKGSINAPLDNPGWGRALGQQISWMVNGHHQTAELNLHPADLGPMQVVLSVENRQAELMFVSREPAVREAIEHAMPHLRDMLANAGIQLGQANVSAEHTPRQTHGETSPHASSREQQDSDAVVAVPQPAPRRGSGLVDMFA